MPNPNAILTSVDVVCEILEANPDASQIVLATYPQKTAPPPINDLGKLKHILLRHKENEEYPPFERSQLPRDEVLRMCNKIAPDRCLAIRSRVISSANEAKFIPMLDFVCEKNDANGRLLAALVRQIHENEEIGIESGFLLETANSYHYYGRSVLSYERWTKFIAFSLLLHPPAHYLEFAMLCGASSKIDTRFLAHSLIAGQGSLRISADPDGRLPRVIAMIR
jgi:hypothetical protein